MHHPVYCVDTHGCMWVVMRAQFVHTDVGKPLSQLSTSHYGSKHLTPAVPSHRECLIRKPYSSARFCIKPFQQARFVPCVHVRQSVSPSECLRVRPSHVCNRISLSPCQLSVATIYRLKRDSFNSKQYTPKEIYRLNNLLYTF